MTDNKLSFSKLVLIIVVLLTVVAIAYSFIFKQNPPITVQPTSTPTISPSPIVATSTPTPTPTPTLLPTPNIDISDWKMYRSKNYGFTIKYPENWILEERPKDGWGDQLYRIFFHDNNNWNNWFNIDIFDNATGLSIDQYLAQTNFYTQGKTKQSIALDGVAGVRITYLKIYPEGSYTENQDYILIPHNKQIIQFSLSFDAAILDQTKIDQIQPVLNKILSTFKFIK